MASTLAKTYVVLSGAILLVVGVVGLFRHEMFNLTFPPAHNIFHLVSGAIALWAALGKREDGSRRFGLIFGTIYTLVAIAGFAGVRDFGALQLDLNTHFNFIHLGVGLLSLAAGFAGAKPAVAPQPKHLLPADGEGLSSIANEGNHVVKRSGEMGRNCQACSELKAQIGRASCRERV